MRRSVAATCTRYCGAASAMAGDAGLLPLRSCPVEAVEVVKPQPRPVAQHVVVVQGRPGPAVIFYCPVLLAHVDDPEQVAPADPQLESGAVDAAPDMPGS